MGRIRYRKATIEDIDLLTQMRLEELKEKNKIWKKEDISIVALETYRYCRKGIRENNYVAYFICDEDKPIGLGGVSFSYAMPTVLFPLGQVADITNMYIKKEYKEKNLKPTLEELLLKEAKERGIHSLRVI